MTARHLCDIALKKRQVDPLYVTHFDMNRIEQQNEKSPFHTLKPDTVITLVEDTLGVHCTNLFRPLNSYINRVFELEQEDGTGLIIKFYRPGRWSKTALQDEHDFLMDSPFALMFCASRRGIGIVSPASMPP